MLKLKIEAANGAEMREQLEALLGVYGGSKELVEYQPKQDVTITVVPPVKEEAEPEEVIEEVKTKRTRKSKKDEEVKFTEAEKTNTKSDGQVKFTVAGSEEETAEEETAEEETTEEETTSSVTKEQLIQEVVNASRKGQRDAVQKLLADFGAERTTALKPEQYQDFYNKITKL